MKKINKVFNTAVAIGSAVVLAFVATSCDMLQSMLSSEQEQELTSETGTASLSGSTWYYNGSSESNMTSTTDNTLCISFGKKVALSTSGLSGSFTITYTDANSNSTTVTKDLNGGSFSSDYTSYYLNLSPVISLLDTTTIPAGTMAVQVKVSGFVCDEGSQKGRSIDTFKKNISVEPLYASSTLKGITFNTLYATSGNAIKIPLNGVTTLASDASVEVTAKTGSSLPDGLTSSNFTVSASTDGLSLLVTPNVEMNQQNFCAYLTIGGLVPALNGAEKTQSFLVNFVGAIMSDDTTLTTYASDTSVNKAISSMTLSNDASNLYVSLSFNATPTAWENDHIVIMIDDTNLESGVSTIASSTTGAPATYTTVGSTVEFFGYEIMKSGSPVNMTSDTTWTQNASDWKYYGSNTTVKYTIPFSSIGTTVASSSDTLHVVAFFSAGWSSTDSHISNAVPASALTVSTTSGTADTVAVDFSKGLSMTIGSTGETVTYKTPVTPTLVVSGKTATTVKLAWTASYGATAYTLSRSTDNETFTTISTSITNNSYTDSGLSASTKYYYKVAAANSSGTSDFSSVVNATTNTFSASLNNYTATTATLDWETVGSTATYTVSYKISSDSTYTTFVSGTSNTTEKITGLTMGKTYDFIVAVDNTTTVSASVSATLYPTITLDGTLESDWSATDGSVASSSTSYYSSASDSAAGTEYYDMKTLYVTNDADYLYVAIAYNDTPRGINKANINVMFDNTSVTGDTISYTNIWMSPATTTTLSNGQADFVAYETPDWGSASMTGFTATSSKWTWETGDTYYGNSKYSEYKIPLSSVGSVGNTIRLFASFSNYSYSSSNAEQLLDCIPSSAATVSTTTNTNDTLTVDFDNALSYTIK